MSHILAQKQLRSIILSVSPTVLSSLLSPSFLRIPLPSLRLTYSLQPSPFRSTPPPFHPAQNVIRSTTPINDEMAHQLYVLQVLTFNLLEDRMMTKMDPQDQVGTKSELPQELFKDTAKRGRSYFHFEIGCDPQGGGRGEKSSPGAVDEKH